MLLAYSHTIRGYQAFLVIMCNGAVNSSVAQNTTTTISRRRVQLDFEGFGYIR